MDETRTDREALARWVSAGLITREQAAAIESFEASAQAPEGRRVPLVAEALGYLGAALAVAAGLAFLAQVWDELGRGGQLASLGTAGVLLWVGGWLLRRQGEPALERLMSVLWFLSVGAAAGFCAALVPEDGWERARLATLLAGAGATVYGGALYLTRRRALQVVALFGGVLVLAYGLLMLAGTEAEQVEGWTFNVATWALGGILGLLGWRRLVEPAGATVVIAGVALVAGPLPGEEEWLLVLGLATSGLLMAASVGLRRTALLGVGAVGVFLYVTRLSQEFFGETAGAPLALLVAGVALVALALVVARLRRFTGAPPPVEPRG